MSDEFKQVTEAVWTLKDLISALFLPVIGGLAWLVKKVLRLEGIVFKDGKPAVLSEDSIDLKINKIREEFTGQHYNIQEEFRGKVNNIERKVDNVDQNVKEIKKHIEEDQKTKDKLSETLDKINRKLDESK